MTKTWVEGYTKKDGTKVKGYFRNKRKNYSPTKMSDARKKFLKHIIETNPDVQKTSEVTYRFPNPDWEDHMNKSDVIGIDTKDQTRIPPEVSELPEHPKPGQVVLFEGKTLIYDKSQKRFKQYHE